MDNSKLSARHTFKSNKESIRYVEPLLFDFKKKLSIGDEQFYSILIAVTEAVNNAIIHGNECHPQKEVSISIEYVNSDLIITVTDEGCGFDHSKIADPRKPENLLKESGRGVFLIKEIADEVKFVSRENGAVIIMKFNMF